jgi:hypothetical protein
MSFCLVSCYDNSLVNNDQPFSFDSARFTVVHQKEAPYGYWGVYISDTDKIYLSGSAGFTYYRNGGFVTQPFNNNFRAESNIDGFNENNLYIGGGENLSGNNYRYKLIKWNGADFEQILVPDTVSGISHYFSSVYFKSTNEIWLGGGDGTAWKYDGMNFRKYILDTNSGNPQNWTNTYLFSDGSDKICCVQVRDSVNFSNTSGIRYFEFYRLNSSGDLELTTSIKYDNVYGPAYVKRAGNSMYTVSKDGLYSFDGYTFNKITDIGPISHPYYSAAETGLNDIMISGTEEDKGNQVQCLYNWNGVKWSKESKSISQYFYTNYLIYVNNMYVTIESENKSSIIKFLKRN